MFFSQWLRKNVAGLAKKSDCFKFAQDLMGRGFFKDAIPGLIFGNRFSKHKLYKFGEFHLLFIYQLTTTNASFINKRTQPQTTTIAEKQNRAVLS